MLQLCQSCVRESETRLHSKAESCTLFPIMYAMCCSMLQWLSVCCSVLLCVAVFYSVLQCFTLCCSVLGESFPAICAVCAMCAVCCSERKMGFSLSVLQRVAVVYHVSKYVILSESFPAIYAVCCNIWQHVAVC